jgi:hypothetical protein
MVPGWQPTSRRPFIILPAFRESLAKRSSYSQQDFAIYWFCLWLSLGGAGRAPWQGSTSILFQNNERLG